MCRLAICCAPVRSRFGSNNSNNSAPRALEQPTTMAAWASSSKSQQADAVKHYDGRASSSVSQQAIAVKMEALTFRADQDTAKKNGWTLEMQTIKFASSLHAMCLSIARLLHDDHELRRIAANKLDGFEIEELFQYLTDNNVAKDLLNYIYRVRGGPGRNLLPHPPVCCAGRENG